MNKHRWEARKVDVLVDPDGWVRAVVIKGDGGTNCVVGPLGTSVPVRDVVRGLKKDVEKEKSRIVRRLKDEGYL